MKITLKPNQTKTILHEKAGDLEITLSRGSNLTLVLLPRHFNDLNHYTKVNINFIGEGAGAKVLGLIIGKNKAKFEITTNSIHQVPHTNCLTSIRGVLFDKSKLNYEGAIKIEKKAQNTQSFLESKMLHLGEKVQSEVTPQLEIEADEVKASHSATIGKIDQEELFYLQSRGLNKSQAEKLLVESFFEPLISMIEDEKTAGLVRVKLTDGIKL